MRTQRRRASARLASLEAIARWTRWVEAEQKKPQQDPEAVAMYIAAVKAALQISGDFRDSAV